MVWGCMGWNGVRRLVEVEGKMDANQYVSILADGLLPSIGDLDIQEEEMIFPNTPTSLPKNGSMTRKSMF